MSEQVHVITDVPVTNTKNFFHRIPVKKVAIVSAAVVATVLYVATVKKAYMLDDETIENIDESNPEA